MIQEFITKLDSLVGGQTKSITVWQMGLRAIILYVAAVLLARLGKKRFLGKNSTFDVIFSVLFGSFMARPINDGSIPFFETILGAGLAMVLMHWLFAVLAFRSDRFGTLIKGHASTLVENGEIKWDAMRDHSISEKDLREALRAEGKVTELSQVQEACLERSGNISVIPKKPKTVETAVHAGVQTIRVQFE
jgi:uncharacterized membrane protein YcaP (DUF421 family)